ADKSQVRADAPVAAANASRTEEKTGSYAPMLAPPTVIPPIKRGRDKAKTSRCSNARAAAGASAKKRLQPAADAVCRIASAVSPEAMPALIDTVLKGPKL